MSSEAVAKKLDPTAVKLYQNSLSKLVGLPIKCNLNCVPYLFDLINNGIKVIDFRVPKLGDFFISVYREISRLVDDNRKSLSEEIFNGYRFILGNKEMSDRSLLSPKDKLLLDPKSVTLFQAVNYRKHFNDCFIEHKNGIPLSGELAFLGMEVIAFRKPKIHEWFINNYGKVVQMKCSDFFKHLSYYFIVNWVRDPVISGVVGDLDKVAEGLYECVWREHPEIILHNKIVFSNCDGIPYERSLNALNIEVVAFRRPRGTDCFLKGNYVHYYPFVKHGLDSDDYFIVQLKQQKLLT